MGNSIDQQPEQQKPVEDKKFYAVEYAGRWQIQPSPYYEDYDKDILDAESAGEESAEKYANLIADLLNKHHGK